MFKYGKTRQLKDLQYKLRNVYKNNIPQCVMFTGSVKADGMATGIVDVPGMELYYQTRTTDSLTCYEADPVLKFERWFKGERARSAMKYMQSIRDDYPEFKNTLMVVYGEWCGKGTKSSSLVIMEKFFYVYGVAFIYDMDRYNDPDDAYKGVFLRNPPLFMDEDNRIFDSRGVAEYHVNIQQNDDKLHLPILEEQLTSVTDDCPLLRYLGAEKKVGAEGIVYKHYTPEGIMVSFKLVTEKYRKTKQKPMIVVDPIHVQNCSDFAELTCTENRIDQAIFELGITDLKMPDLGKICPWISNDIANEEADGLLESGIVVKELGKHISKITATYVKTLINKEK